MMVFEHAKLKKRIALACGMAALVVLSLASKPSTANAEAIDGGNGTEAVQGVEKIDRVAIVENILDIAKTSHRDALIANTSLCSSDTNSLKQSVARDKAQKAWSNGRRHFAQAQVFAAMDPKLASIHQTLSAEQNPYQALEKLLWQHFDKKQFDNNCAQVTEALEQALQRLDDKTLRNTWTRQAEQTLRRFLGQISRFAWESMVQGNIRPALHNRDYRRAKDHHSDSNHWRLYYQAQGLKNLYEGEYLDIHEGVISGTSLQHLAEHEYPAIAKAMNKAMAEVQWQSLRMTAAAEDKYSPLKFSAMVSGNRYGESLLVRLSDSLKKLSAIASSYKEAIAMN